MKCPDCFNGMRPALFAGPDYPCTTPGCVGGEIRAETITNDSAAAPDLNPVDPELRMNTLAGYLSPGTYVLRRTYWAKRMEAQALAFDGVIEATAHTCDDSAALVVTCEHTFSDHDGFEEHMSKVRPAGAALSIAYMHKAPAEEPPTPEQCERAVLIEQRVESVQQYYGPDRLCWSDGKRMRKTGPEEYRAFLATLSTKRLRELCD
ncbi:MAG: hypothetical protein VYA51_12690 [Planctomycetota bacterium]|nr:hypothetical protein [Planctomycetota bacterium]